MFVLDHLRRHYSRSERERPAFVEFPWLFRLDFIDSPECRTYYGKIILYDRALAVTTCQIDRHTISAKNSLTLSTLLGSSHPVSSIVRALAGSTTSAVAGTGIPNSTRRAIYGKQVLTKLYHLVVMHWDMLVSLV